MLSALLWYHADLIDAVTSFFNSAPIEKLMPMAPENLERVYYRAELDVMLLAFSFALFKVIQLRRRRDVRDGQGAVAMLAGVLAVMVLISGLTYRTLTLHPLERVDLNDARCYINGGTVDEALLFCPETDPPRNRMISRSALEKAKKETEAKKDPITNQPRGKVMESPFRGLNPARSRP
jgi:hypothetical protein